MVGDGWDQEELRRMEEAEKKQVVVEADAQLPEPEHEPEHEYEEHDYEAPLPIVPLPPDELDEEDPVDPPDADALRQLGATSYEERIRKLLPEETVNKIVIKAMGRGVPFEHYMRETFRLGHDIGGFEPTDSSAENTATDDPETEDHLILKSIMDESSYDHFLNMALQRHASIKKMFQVSSHAAFIEREI
jgi:hypothetical protein